MSNQQNAQPAPVAVDEREAYKRCMEKFANETGFPAEGFEIWQAALQSARSGQAKPCGLCGADEPFTGTCGGGQDNPKALCFKGRSGQDGGDAGQQAEYWGALAQQKADADARRGVTMPVSYYASTVVGALLSHLRQDGGDAGVEFGTVAVKTAPVSGMRMMDYQLDWGRLPDGVHKVYATPQPAAVSAEGVLRSVMSRLAEMLDEDQFAHIENLVTRAGIQPPASTVQGAGQAVGDESDYRRGYRHGYNQRDAEVKGALT